MGRGAHAVGDLSLSTDLQKRLWAGVPRMPFLSAVPVAPRWDELDTLLHIVHACGGSGSVAAQHLLSSAAPAATGAVPEAAPPAVPAPAAPPPAEAPLEEEDPATSVRVLGLLSTRGVVHTTLVHAPTRTSEESAAVRGVSLASGAKALFMKAKAPLEHGSPYVLAVVSAVRKADLAALKRSVNTKNMGMASAEEVWALTGCRPGAVPPFGSLFPGVRTVVDRSLLVQGSTINFNAGLRTLSVGMSVADYISVENPTVLDFTSPP